jgi:prepilin-type N-terminal cleavage/methylation domain-containing protein
MTARRRGGFSLVELLVVIAIIALLLLLLLPAVNAVRELGRRTQCISNQRNVALALIHYEATHGTFPAAVPVCDDRVYISLGREAGITCMGPNWASQMLGHIEEVDRYEKVLECIRTQWHASDDCVNQPGEVGRTTPAFMVCPSAPAIYRLHSSPFTHLDQLSKGNYAACLGAEHYRTAIEDTRRVAHDRDDVHQIGIMSVVTIRDYREMVEKTRSGEIPGDWKFAHGQGTPAKKIKDGTARTILISEVLGWDGAGSGDSHSVDLRGVWTSPSMGASTYTHKYGPNSPMPDRINGCDRRIDRSQPLHCEQLSSRGPDAAETWASARSAHREGVVAALADGSVRFFADDIHLPLWQDFATRAGQ